MRLQLVNLMDDHHKRYSTASISQPPLCLGVLHALTPKDIDCVVLDEQVDSLCFDGDVIAFSVTTQLAKKAYLYADRLRRRGKMVILGGYHVSVCADEAAQHADAIITGEAETVWPTLCADLFAGRLKSRYDGGPTPSDAMPLIDRSLFAKKGYVLPASLYASRGCVYNCTFCGSSRILGGYRHKPLALLEREIDALRAAHGNQVLQFTDDNLLADTRWRTELLALLARKHVHFVCQVTLDQLCDTTLIDALASAGCIAVATGIESVDEENAVTVNKMQNLRKPVVASVRHANTRGIHVIALLIYGLDNDSPASVERSVGRLRAMGFSVFDAGILRPLPGTALYASMLKEGRTFRQWWLADEPYASNELLPGYLRVYFHHGRFTPLSLQRCTVDAIAGLNRVTPRDALRLLRIGARSRSIAFTLRLIIGRSWITRQAVRWSRELRDVRIVPDATIAPSAASRA